MDLSRRDEYDDDVARRPASAGSANSLRLEVGEPFSEFVRFGHNDSCLTRSYVLSLEMHRRVVVSAGTEHDSVPNH